MAKLAEAAVRWERGVCVSPAAALIYAKRPLKTWRERDKNDEKKEVRRRWEKQRGNRRANERARGERANGRRLKLAFRSLASSFAREQIVEEGGIEN